MSTAVLVIGIQAPVQADDSPFPASTGMYGAFVPPRSDSALSSESEAGASGRVLASPITGYAARDVPLPRMPLCVRETFAVQPPSAPGSWGPYIHPSVEKALMLPLMPVLLPVSMVLFTAKGIEAAARCTYAALPEAGKE
jgi:hypothetical protein